MSLLRALLAAALPLTAAAPAATVPPAAVISTDFPDPDVIEAGGTFLAYSTSSGAGNIPFATAPAADGPWTVRGDALPVRPSWAVACGGGADCGLWAPDVSRRPDGRYLMYFTAPSAAAGRRCIGAALADGPLGPFRPLGDGPLVCDPSEGGAIDPASFTDADGRRYLLYKNDGNAVRRPAIVWLQRVLDDGVTFTGPRRELIRNDAPEEHGVIEAPVLVRRPGQYVLFYSGGPYGDDRYFTGYAVAPTLAGPFTKAYRPLLTTRTLGGAVRGPGGADVLGDRLFFHGWAGTARWMYAASLGWADGFPVVRGSRVRYEAERGTIHHARVRSGAAGASQGAVVAGLDHDDSWVDLRVFAPAAGTYTAYVTYAAGYGHAQHTVTVNGSSAFVLDYPDHGWDRWKEVPATVTLVQGWNTLRFRHHSRWAELDHVELA
ncbi:family 43 glycosylhydrolase [Nonomuraea sp. ATR24]|uniref:family 43 glycosylhydrolase n=1 Tax=unclassified Nonomuraea TaxID=2593643 RepID=UPI00340FBE03